LTIMRGETECQTLRAMSSVLAQSKHIDIVINGQTRAVPQGMMLHQLLSFLEIDPARVAVEMDKAIVRRPAWNTTPVSAGSALEIVQFVGGG
jgi:sulfur carrier protein